MLRVNAPGLSEDSIFCSLEVFLNLALASAMGLILQIFRRFIKALKIYRGICRLVLSSIIYAERAYV